MSEYLPFWPKAAIGGYVLSATPSYFYSRALPTNGFTEVVMQEEVDADFGSSANTKIEIKPEISNDGVNWKELSSTLSIPATTGSGSFPKQLTEKFTEIGAFMRAKVKIINGEGADKWVVGTLLVAGTGRS